VSIDVFDVFKKLKSFKVSISIQEQKLINNFAPEITAFSVDEVEVSYAAILSR